MVVDTTQSAEKCIAFLREHRIGRANFICLDRVSEALSRQFSAPFSVPDQSKRLYDLIKANDPKFNIAFYYGLKDTLVCESVDVAVQINREQDRHG
jgi:structural maintenance of chromosome 4